MDYIVYLIFRGFIALVQALPERTAYAVGRGLLWLARVFRVRVNVVKKNLRLCFPELSDKERMIMLKKNYRYTGEMLVEILLMGCFTAKKENRVQIQNPELVHSYLRAGSSVIIWANHLTNVDYTNWIAREYYLHAIYKKIKNKYFDNWFLSSRAQVGSRMISSRDIKSYFASYSGKNDRGESCVFGLAADQNPGRNNITADFFQYALPFAVGPEVFAQRYDLPMLYMRMERVKPGYYKASFVELKKTNTEFGDRTQQAVALLEADIKQNPAHYFWMHNRFKNVQVEKKSRLGQDINQNNA